MSRSSSPASSLDFPPSDDSGSEADYNPSAHRRAATKRRPAQSQAQSQAVAGPSTGNGTKKIKIKINLGASARSAAALHPMDGDVDIDDEVEEQVAGVMGSRVVDLSNRELKKDHAARPLWVDESGHMYVFVLHAPVVTKVLILG
jgi:DNA excision repair protein ERCC-3